MMSNDLETLARRMGGTEIQRVVYSEEELRRRVDELAREIDAFYPEGQELLVLGLLKGSFIFLADLVRRIHRPLQVDFLVASSYRGGKVSTGQVRLVYQPDTVLEGRHVILVEDVVDSGTTMEYVVPLLEAQRPASLELCALLHKRRVSLKKAPQWVGFEAPEEFLVGYGLDHAESCRHLPFIASM